MHISRHSLKNTFLKRIICMLIIPYCICLNKANKKQVGLVFYIFHCCFYTFKIFFVQRYFYTQCNRVGKILYLAVISFQQIISFLFWKIKKRKESKQQHYNK